MMTLRDSNSRISRLSAACLLLLCGLAMGAPADSATALDSGTPAALRAEPLRLHVRGSFDAPQAHVGDTLEYRLRVSWREAPALVRVLPPRDELRTPGLEVIGQSTLHRKTAGPDGVLNTTEFTYLLVARAPGRGRVAPFALRYLDGVSGREQTVEVAGSALDVTAAHVPLTRRMGLRIGILIAALGVAVALLLGMRGKGRKKTIAPARESAPARELRL